MNRSRGVVDRSNSEHYLWGGRCDGWRLLANRQLSVIEERVPPHGAESWHLHARAIQFFYILSGTACIEIEQTTVRLVRGQGIEVRPGTAHRIVNDSEEDVVFLVISSPTTADDRTELPR